MSRTEGSAGPRLRPPRGLSRALRRLRWSRKPVIWTSTPGTARREQLSIALRGLPRRFRPVRIPYGAIPAAEICAAVLAELEHSLMGDPQAALLEALATRAARRERIVLVIEDAERMPVTEAMRLKALARRSGGALRLLVVTSSGAESGRLEAALAGSSPEPRLPEGATGARPSSAPHRVRPASAPRTHPSLSFPGNSPRPPATSTPSPLAHPAAAQALAALEEGIRRGSRAMALQGPPGMGKTLLLRRLGERLADAFEPVWVPCMALAGHEFLRWILYCRSGVDVPMAPEAAWRRQVLGARAGPRGLLLLLDDAGALGPDAASELAQAIACSDGCLRVAMTCCDAAPLQAAARLPGLQQIRLDEPLSDLHAAALLRARFGKGLDEAAIRRIVEEARGVPAALVRGASALLARRALRPGPLP